MYNSGDPLVVTHPTTSPPISSLADEDSSSLDFMAVRERYTQTIDRYTLPATLLADPLALLTQIRLHSLPQRPNLCPRNPLHQFSILKQMKRRHNPNPKLLRNIRLFIHIKNIKLCFRKLFNEFLNFRGYGFALCAPWSACFDNVKTVCVGDIEVVGFWG